MKIIAFKRGTDSNLHPLYITEYKDAALVPDLKGWETALEEHFLLELAKNPDRQAQQQINNQEQDSIRRQAEVDAEQKRIQQDKDLQREFEQFKMWKLNKGKK